MYNVVLRARPRKKEDDVAGEVHSDGAVTWTSYKSKEDFNADWEAHPGMFDWYEVVAEGVSEERAVELCSTPEAEAAAFSYMLRKGIAQLEQSLKDFANALDASPDELTEQ